VENVHVANFKKRAPVNVNAILQGAVINAVIFAPPPPKIGETANSLEVCSRNRKNTAERKREPVKMFNNPVFGFVIQNVFIWHGVHIVEHERHVLVVQRVLVF
jgi:hypothetical protein